MCQALALPSVSERCIGECVIHCEHGAVSHTRNQYETNIAFPPYTQIT